MKAITRGKIKKILINVALSIGILAACIAMCFFISVYENGKEYVPMLFIFAVFLIARYTEGYAYGIVSVVLAVICNNFLFTYPYFDFNFSLPGYPITIACMLVVSILTSALTSRAKEHARLTIEAANEKTRSNLLRAVSHDLRTPLTSILGATSAVIDNDDVLDKAERLNLLNEVKQDSEWLIRMVENLLSITRMEGDSPKIVKTLEAVEEVISVSVMKFKKRFPNVSVKAVIPDEVLFAPMDAVLIEQVLNNLMDNAVEHGKTTTEIKVSVEKVNQKAVFALADNGEGIPENLLPDKIFGGLILPQNNLQADVKRNMGIGLSVCKTIVKAHGGEMKATNIKEGGAKFEFYLPLQEDNK